MTLAPLPLAAGVDDPVVVGVDQAGDPLALPIASSAGAINLLVGGVPGSGKSNLLSVIIADVARRPHHALLLGDPKFTEFGPWVPRATTVALGVDGQNELLDLAWRELRRRQRALRSEDGYVRVAPVGPEWPRVVLVLDEVAEVTKGSGKDAAARVARLHTILTLGRALGIATVLATQRPSAKVIPMDLRDACQLRVAFKTMSAEQTEMILGSMSVRAHEIPLSQRGVGFVLTDWRPEPVKFRALLMSDDDVVGAARRTAGLRVELPGWPALIDPMEE